MYVSVFYNFRSQTLTAVVEKETSTIPDLFYAVSALSALSQPLSDSATTKLVKTVQAALRKDDSFLK